MTPKQYQLFLFKKLLKIIFLLTLVFGGYKVAMIYAKNIGLSPACNRTFPITAGIGCQDGKSCVPAGKLTATNNCKSSDGICPVSSNTLIGVKKFIATFNGISKGKCVLTISSAIQIKGGPSVSFCHKPGNKKSGTCVDFTVAPATDTCFENFYQAASDSDVVSAYRNEYKKMCYASSQKGYNIHTEFGKSPEPVPVLEPKLIDNTCSEDCIMLCAKKTTGAFGSREIGQDPECLTACTERVNKCLDALLQ